MTQMTPLLVRMPAELLAQIDAARGDVPRAVFIRRCCERIVAPPSFTVDIPDGAEAVRVYKGDPPELVAEVHREPRPMRIAEKLTPGDETIVPLGPPPSVPGSRLKKEKR